jgi:hypothetical protein
MRLKFIATLLLLAAALGLSGQARAAPTVRVLETWPAGDRITLARNQNFNLRLAYSSDQPVGIWVRPYFRGQPANAGTSPSPRYTGDGEMLAWFFLMQPGDEVDEIRITAGDGRVQSTPVVATYRVHVIGGSEASAGVAPPAWVTEMHAQARLAQQRAAEARNQAPVSAGDVALLNGFMLAMLGVGLLGFAGPAWMLLRWRGGWRIAAAVPAIMMAFVVLRIVIGVAIDPTSHNLWPFEILMAGAMSAGVTGLLSVLRKLTGAGQAA